MSNSDILQELESLSSEVVMADPDDLQSLLALQEKFNTLAGMAGENFFDLAAEAASKAAELAGKMLMDEVKDGSAAMETISRTVSSLQEIIRDGRDADGVSFPGELGMKKNDQEASSPKVSLPGNVDQEIFAEFLSQQDSVM